MKIRQGFVSNSSSSSFMIYVQHLTGNQLNQILANDYTDQGDYQDDRWSVSVEGSKVIGYTSMNNYHMDTFFEKIKVPKEVINWSGYPSFESYPDEPAVDPDTERHIFCPNCGCKFKIE